MTAIEKNKSASLYADCLTHDDMAWQTVYNCVVSYLQFKAGGNLEKSDIEDIAGDTVLYFIKGKIHEVEHPGAFLYLLKKKAYCNLLDVYRKNQKQVLVPMDIVKKGDSDKQTFENPELVDTGPTAPDDKIIAIERLMNFIADINALDTGCSHILMRYFQGKAEGMKVKEIADEIGTRPNTFSKKVLRCREKLERFQKRRRNKSDRPGNHI